MEGTDLLRPSSRTFAGHIPSTTDTRQLSNDVQSHPSLKLTELHFFFSYFLLNAQGMTVFSWLVPFQSRSTHWEAGSTTPLRKLIIWCLRDVSPAHCSLTLGSILTLINKSFNLKLVFQKKDRSLWYQKLYSSSLHYLCLAYLSHRLMVCLNKPYWVSVISQDCTRCWNKERLGYSVSAIGLGDTEECKQANHFASQETQMFMWSRKTTVKAWHLSLPLWVEVEVCHIKRTEAWG